MKSDNETIRPNYGELMTVHEALHFTYRLRDCLDKDVLWAQVFLRYLTPEDLAVFETYMGIVEHLHANPKSEIEQKQFDYIRDVTRTLVGRSRQTIRAMGPKDRIERFNRVKKTALNTNRGNERKWSGAKVSD